MGNNSSSKGMMYDHSGDKINFESSITLHDHYSMETRQTRLVEATIVGAIKGVANIGVTAVSAIADNRTYYKCPRCKREVYAYGSFADNICLDCPGTVISSIGSTLSMSSGTSVPQKVANSFASEATQTVTDIGGVIGNVATLQFHDNGNGTKADWNGSVIFELSKGASSPTTDESSLYRSESVQSITAVSCGIYVAVLDGSGMDHWWMNIKTSMGHYQIQFKKEDSVIQVRRCDSVSHCNQNGLTEANRDENVLSSIESSYSKSNISKRTLGDLISWLESGGMSSNYSLFNNNCQDLCKRIYEWI